MALIPTPIAPAAGQPITAADHLYLLGVLDWYRNPPAASAYRDAATSPANNTWTALFMDGEDYDRTGMHVTSSPNYTRMTFSHDGRYEVTARMVWSANATGIRRMMVRLNSAGSDSGGSLMAQDAVAGVSGAVASITTVFSRVFSTGDYIELFHLQSSGGALALQVGPRNCGLEVKWMGDT